jgi:hypothetical protein
MKGLTKDSGSAANSLLNTLQASETRLLAIIAKTAEDTRVTRLQA